MDYYKEVIDYIENDSEILIPVERLFKDGKHITQKEYGLVLLEILVEELKKRFSVS